MLLATKCNNITINLLMTPFNDDQYNYSLSKYLRHYKINVIITRMATVEDIQNLQQNFKIGSDQLFHRNCMKPNLSQLKVSTVHYEKHTWKGLL